MPEPLTNEIILQLMFVALFMVFFGMLLNWILGLKPSKMKELRKKAKNLRERFHQAQILGDALLIQQLNLETMQLMKVMLKKQLLPLGIRCVIFLGIFIVIGMIFGQYEFWFWIYFLFSLIFGMSAMGIRYLYKKATGKEDKRKLFAKEIMGSILPSKQGSLIHLPGQPDSSEALNSLDTQEESKSDKESKESDKTDAWKDRIQN